jgi:septum formation protein
VKTIILASGSPRRKALLEALGLKLTVITSDADEIFEGIPADIVVRNAEAKRDEVLPRIEEDALVIAADTLVFKDDHVMGKPRDLDEAKVMVRRLSGATHRVLTGVAVADTGAGSRAAGYESTEVTFRELSAAEIDAFVHAVNPVDRAGAYTIEGPGSLLVARYDGCYQNVLGLPIVRLDRLLRELGHSLFDLMDASRSRFL